MNNTLDTAMSLATKINEERSSFPDNVQVIIAPPALFMGNLLLMHDPAFDLAAQNCNQHDFGAFTGEISPAMLHDMSIPYCIIGHSERRTYYHETDELLKLKVAGCIRNHVKPIFCIGESLEERKSGSHFEVLHKQIANALITPEKDQMKGTVIAYEPVWAIGTGLTATSDQIEEVHSFIRLLIEENFGIEAAENVQILYGGSMKPSNAHEIMSCPNVDGGLIGGASLHSHDFVELIQIAGK